jgi:hypothetical protein
VSVEQTIYVHEQWNISKPKLKQQVRPLLWEVDAMKQAAGCTLQFLITSSTISLIKSDKQIGI